MNDLIENTALLNSTKALAEWNEWIADRSKVTQESYNVTIKSFLIWLKEQGTGTLDRSTIIDYKNYLTTPHTSRKTGTVIKFTADTAAKYFRGVKMFFHFLTVNGYCEKDITDNVRSPKASNPLDHKRDCFSRDNSLTILNSINKDTLAGKRDYAIILTCLSCGLRIIELQRASIGDIEHIDGETRLYIQGKGHDEKDDYKKIEPELADAIKDYLKARGTKEATAPLFASIGTNARHGGTRLTEPSISRLIKTVLVKAGFDSKRLTAHSLRHTSITLDRLAGASIEEASRHARHSDITVTQRYDHALEKENATDERRILNYLFDKEEAPTDQARDIMARIPARNQGKAIELLQALAL